MTGRRDRGVPRQLARTIADPGALGPRGRSPPSRGAIDPVIKYIVRRLLGAIPVLFGLSIILFAFIHLLPGDPAATILGQHARPELVEAMRHRLGLDQPLWQQYFNYMSDLLHGDLGRSFVNNRSVVNDFFVRFPGTIELTIAALIFAVGLGHPARALGGAQAAELLGRVHHRRLAGRDQHPDLRPRPVAPVRLRGPAPHAAGHRPDRPAARGPADARTSCSSTRSWPDGPTRSSTRSGTSSCRRSPSARSRSRSSPGSPGPPCSTSPNEDYVRTARAKGLTEKRVDNRHIMRNAWLPVVDGHRAPGRRAPRPAPSSPRRSSPGTAWASGWSRRSRPTTTS